MGFFFYLLYFQLYLKLFYNKFKFEVLVNIDQLVWLGFKYFFFVNRFDYLDIFKNVDYR